MLAQMRNFVKLLRYFLVFFGAALCGAAGAAGQSDEAAAAADELQLAAEVVALQKYLDDTASMTARFDSVLLDTQMRESGASTGTVYIKRPGKFRWEYQTPSPSIVLADGERLWSYDEELEQAIVRRLADYRGANPTLLLGGDADVTESFSLVKSYQTPEVRWLELAPKDNTSDFVKVRLGFRDDVIYLMELFDRLEQITRIRFSDVETNLVLADTLFEFVPPDNVDVVGAAD